MAEVDVAQIHFTAVHRWMDRGLSEWLAEVGHPFTALLETGPGIPIVESRCSFVGRILLDDVIDQRSEIGGDRPHLLPQPPSLHARRARRWREGSWCTCASIARRARPSRCPIGCGSTP